MNFNKIKEILKFSWGTVPIVALVGSAIGFFAVFSYSNQSTIPLGTLFQEYHWSFSLMGMHCVFLISLLFLFLILPSILIRASYKERTFECKLYSNFCFIFQIIIIAVIYLFDYLGPGKYFEYTFYFILFLFVISSLTCLYIKKIKDKIKLIGISIGSALWYIFPGNIFLIFYNRDITNMKASIFVFTYIAFCLCIYAIHAVLLTDNKWGKKNRCVGFVLISIICVLPLLQGKVFLRMFNKWGTMPLNEKRYYLIKTSEYEKIKGRLPKDLNHSKDSDGYSRIGPLNVLGYTGSRIYYLRPTHNGKHNALGFICRKDIMEYR